MLIINKIFEHGDKFLGFKNDILQEKIIVWLRLYYEGFRFIGYAFLKHNKSY